MNSALQKYMTAEKLKNRMHKSIKIYESLTGTKVPQQHKDAVAKFVGRKIDFHLDKGDIVGGLLAIATIALIKLKMRGRK